MCRWRSTTATPRARPRAPCHRAAPACSRREPSYGRARTRCAASRPEARTERVWRGAERPRRPVASAHDAALSHGDAAARRAATCARVRWRGTRPRPVPRAASHPRARATSAGLSPAPPAWRPRDRRPPALPARSHRSPARWWGMASRAAGRRPGVGSRPGRARPGRATRRAVIRKLVRGPAEVRARRRRRQRATPSARRRVRCWSRGRWPVRPAPTPARRSAAPLGRVGRVSGRPDTRVRRSVARRRGGCG